MCVCLDRNHAVVKIFILEGDVESFATIVTSLNTLTENTPQWYDPVMVGKWVFKNVLHYIYRNFTIL